MSIRISIVVGVAALVSIVATTSHAVDFAHQVMPVLKKHCGKCHTGDKKEGGLSMNTRAELLAGGEFGAAVVSGDAAQSRLIDLIASDDPDERMPPEGPRVSPEQLAVLTKWINEGLPWDDGITLGKAAWEPPLQPRNVKLPPAIDGRDHPIDRLLDAYLATHQQPRPARVGDAQFMRRAYFDAIGLPPSPEELKEFLDDGSSDKRAKLIDRLLANDVAYADHWLTTWNDLLRNGYTGTGFITGGRSQITPWLYKSLRENKPYDQFVRDLISPAKESAGFINGIQWRGDTNASQTRNIQFAQNVSQVFLGINMKCASCHDSFIDRWKLEEAYNLAAIYAEQPLELHRCDKPTGKMATPKWLFPEIGDVDPRAPKAERLRQLASLMTHQDNGRFTRTLVNRLWHRLMGRGIVHPVDSMHTQPFSEDLIDYLALRFAEDGYDLRKLIRLIMTSQAYQSQTVVLAGEPGEDYVYAGPLARRMTAEQLLDSIWQITGTHPSKADAKVDRTLDPLPAKAPLPARQTPITAKWIWHDGQGATKAEFRRNIELDAVPEKATLQVTCDNAFTLMVNGDVVATSKNWQTPVRVDLSENLREGENQFAVTAEMFGGSAGFICQLVTSGERKPQIVISDQTWQVRKPGGEWMVAKEVGAYGGGPWGRVFDTRAVAPNHGPPTAPIRAALVKNDFLMRSLGRPNRDQVVSTRPGELTTLQAIDLSNGEILSGYLSRGAKNLVQNNKSNDELIDWLTMYALSRKPTTEERAVLAEIVGDARDPIAVEDLLWAIFMLPEFQIVR